MTKLIFNRYWISDSSGHGVNKWHYFMGNFCGDSSYAKEHILETLETWAQWADRYSMEVELDIVPTKEYINAAVKEHESLARYYTESTARLESLLNYFEDER